MPVSSTSRVDGEELSRRGVVVAPDQVYEAGGVGVAAGVAEWGVAGEAAAGFGVAPGVVAGGGGEGAAGVDDAADGSEEVADEVVDGAGGEVDLLDGGVAGAVDVGVGASPSVGATS